MFAVYGQFRRILLRKIFTDWYLQKSFNTLSISVCILKCNKQTNGLFAKETDGIFLIKSFVFPVGFIIMQNWTNANV